MSYRDEFISKANNYLNAANKECQGSPKYVTV